MAAFFMITSKVMSPTTEQGFGGDGAMAMQYIAGAIIVGALIEMTVGFSGLIGRPGSELWVMERPPEGVIAYAVLWCIVDQGELANLAVRPEYRGQGYAARLLDHVLRNARERDVEAIYLEVRASNERALELYEGFGFLRVGVRKNYYDKPKEDALVMRMLL